MVRRSLTILALVCGFSAAEQIESCPQGACVPETDEDFVKLSLANSMQLTDDSSNVSASADVTTFFGGGSAVGSNDSLTPSFEEIMEAARGHHWTYKAPKAWVTNFPFCGGSRQSPIDIKPASATNASANLGMTATFSSVSGVSMTNNGHALQVNGKFGELKAFKETYHVKQIHFHFPSEHKVNGKNMAGEMHIVTQRKGATKTDGLAVVGVLLKKAKSAAAAKRGDAFFSALGWRGKLPSKGKTVKVSGAVHLGTVLQKQLKGMAYSYEGSLTTPPCSETVHWYILKKPVLVSAATVKKFKAIFPNPMNNRPVNALNGRKLKVLRGR